MVSCLVVYNEWLRFWMTSNLGMVFESNDGMMGCWDDVKMEF